MDLKGKLLRIEYVPLSQVILWERNPKEHDIGSIVQSIKQHGFRDAPIYDATLNDGIGGIVAGNGRSIAVQMMKDSGEDAPLGIGVDSDGEWYVPVQFGIDAGSQAMAEAFAIDHNSLVMSGGDFSALDVSRLYDERKYLDLLKDLVEQDRMPVAINGDDLDLLLTLNEESNPPSLDDLTNEYGDPQERDFWPIIRVQVSPETNELYESLIAQVEGDEASRFDKLMRAVDVSIFSNNEANSKTME